MLSVKVWNVGVLVTLVLFMVTCHGLRWQHLLSSQVEESSICWPLVPVIPPGHCFSVRLCQSFILPALIWCASGGLFQLIAQIEGLMGTKINICVCLAVCPRKFNCGALSSFQNKRRLWNLGTLTIIVLCGTFFVCLAPLIFRKTYHMIY